MTIFCYYIKLTCMILNNCKGYIFKNAEARWLRCCDWDSLWRGRRSLWLGLEAQACKVSCPSFVRVSNVFHAFQVFHFEPVVLRITLHKSFFVLGYQIWQEAFVYTGKMFLKSLLKHVYQKVTFFKWKWWFVLVNLICQLRR